MTNKEFTSTLNEIYSTKNKQSVIIFMSSITKLSQSLCNKIVDSLWNCSDPDSFGENMYNLLDASANDNVEFTPVLKDSNCNLYIMYLDEHTAAFALYKINKT